MLHSNEDLPKHLAALNAAQTAAVVSPASVLQVLAGPGSGKTRVITCRVVHLIKSARIDPSNIIVATFTNKAANEMRLRIQAMLGTQMPSNLVIGTFHATCRKYLINYGHYIKLHPNFRVADADEGKSIIKKIIKRIKSEMDPSIVQSRISHIKSNNEDVTRLMSTKRGISDDLVKIYREYETELREQNLLDFDDLLIKTVQLLRKRPECVSNIQHVLIDEYQDTNMVQFELMSYFASAQSVITVVGDPDQSIYGFRSADRRNLKKLLQRYKETETIVLEESYRSTGAILHTSLTLIEQETSRPPKSLQSTIICGTPPTYRRIRDSRCEGTWLAREVHRIVKCTGGLIKYGDIAVLLRSASLSFEVERGLDKAGIPYQLTGGKRFFDRAEIKDIISYLRLINDYNDNSALIRVINVPSRGLGENNLNKLISESEKLQKSLWATLNSFCEGNVYLKNGEKIRSNLLTFVRTIEELGHNKESVDVLIQQILQKTSYHKHLQSKNPHNFQEKLENIRQLQEFALDTRLRSLDDDLPDIGLERNSTCRTALGDFLAHISLMSDMVGNAGENCSKDVLTISTIHAAKGLEWPVVFVPSIYQGSIPHSRAQDTDEERRLLFVAMTRAQRNLPYLPCSDLVLLYLSFPSRKQSAFINVSLRGMLASQGPLFDSHLLDDFSSVLGRERPTQDVVKLLSESLNFFDDKLLPEETIPSEVSGGKEFCPLDKRSSRPSLREKPKIEVTNIGFISSREMFSNASIPPETGLCQKRKENSQTSLAHWINKTEPSKKPKRSVSPEPQFIMLSSSPPKEDQLESKTCQNQVITPPARRKTLGMRRMKPLQPRGD